MIEKIYTTPCGNIHYYVSDSRRGGQTLVFLPGLTADHRLFDKQIAYFEGKYDLFVWDAPGHAASRPFALTFSLFDKTRWLREILEQEGMENCILVGQSMGGYVAQAYMELFPGKAAGFISIDSAPLQRHYVTAAEIWLLQRMDPVYRLYPWKLLRSSGSKGCAETAYGRELMGKMMDTYADDHAYYARLSGHGYRMLAEAMAVDLPYVISCPALLLCGEKDKAGSTKRYNLAWHRHTNLPLHLIPAAGHNANTDAPETINALIEDFAASTR